MKCPKCETEFEGRYCPNCGFDSEEPDTYHRKMGGVLEKEEMLSDNLLLKIVIILIAIIFWPITLLYLLLANPGGRLFLLSAIVIGVSIYAVLVVLTLLT